MEYTQARKPIDNIGCMGVEYLVGIQLEYVKCFGANKVDVLHQMHYMGAFATIIRIIF